MRDNTVNLREQELKTLQAFPSEQGPIKSRPRPRAKLVVIILAALAVVWYAWSLLASSMSWHAVFLSNNQVYFGHFWDLPFASKITLKDVYYLQVTQPSQQLSGQDQSQLKLIKLGNEIHGPTSEMVIPLSQVLFWETLRPDSAIVKTIQNGQPQT